MAIEATLFTHSVETLISTSQHIVYDFTC